MTLVLVATESVHTSAAAADYLEDRLGPGDTVIGLAVVAAATSARDGADALNVLEVRLVDSDVETVRQRGEPAGSVLEVARDRDVDEIVIGVRAGDPDGPTHGLGGTAANILSDADRPVVVIPT